MRSDRVSNQTLGWSSNQGAYTNKIIIVGSENDKGLGSECLHDFKYHETIKEMTCKLVNKTNFSVDSILKI